MQQVDRHHVALQGTVPVAELRAGTAPGRRGGQAVGGRAPVLQRRFPEQLGRLGPLGGRAPLPQGLGQTRQPQGSTAVAPGSGLDRSAEQCEHLLPDRGRRPHGVGQHPSRTGGQPQCAGELGRTRVHGRHHRVGQGAGLPGIAAPSGEAAADEQGSGQVEAPPGFRRAAGRGEFQCVPEVRDRLVDPGDRGVIAPRGRQQAEAHGGQQHRSVRVAEVRQCRCPAAAVPRGPQVFAVLVQAVAHVQHPAEIDQPHPEEIVPFGGGGHRFPEGVHRLVQFAGQTRPFVVGGQHIAEVAEHHGPHRVAPWQECVGPPEQAQGLGQIRPVADRVESVPGVQGHRRGEQT